MALTKKKCGMYSSPIVINSRSYILLKIKSSPGLAHFTYEMVMNFSPDLKFLSDFWLIQSFFLVFNLLLMPYTVLYITLYEL